MNKFITAVSRNFYGADSCLIPSNFRVDVHKKYSTKPSPQSDEEFRVLDLKKTGGSGRRGRRQLDKKSPAIVERGRADAMPVDQDWPSVWPAPRSFHPAVVPLPIRQGINKLGAPPNKFGNAELMKIPNFLHLTPPAVDRHTEALRRFCSPWPQDLDVEQCLPVEVTTSSYCHASPDIRQPLARIVTLKVPMRCLELDAHAKDKFLRLMGDKYDPETDSISIVSSKCPLRKQNYDYALYLLTAVYYESWRVEEWEKEKSEADMEMFVWDQSKSKENVKRTVGELDPASPRLQNYVQAVTTIFDEGENDYNWDKYREASEQLLFPDNSKSS